MTPAQLQSLRQLIAADRDWRSRRERGELVSQDDRGVEISRIFGIAPRTARALEELGLAESVQLTQHLSRLYLGRFAPFDPEDT